MNTQLILNVVRGVTDWTTLRNLGIRRNGQVWYLEPYADPVLITSDDLLAGFKKYFKNPKALKDWASFILVASNLISFEILEKDPNGDKLIDALWRASFGEEINPKDLSPNKKLDKG